MFPWHAPLQQSWAPLTFVLRIATTSCTWDNNTFVQQPSLGQIALWVVTLMLKFFTCFWQVEKTLCQSTDNSCCSVSLHLVNFVSNWIELDQFLPFAMKRDTNEPMSASILVDQNERNASCHEKSWSRVDQLSRTWLHQRCEQTTQMHVWDISH